MGTLSDNPWNRGFSTLPAPNEFAANVANAMTVLQNNLRRPCDDPDWWQAVLIELHDALAMANLREPGGCRYLTRLERRTLADWLGKQAAGFQE